MYRPVTLLALLLMATLFGALAVGPADATKEGHTGRPPETRADASGRLTPPTLERETGDGSSAQTAQTAQTVRLDGGLPAAVRALLQSSLRLHRGEQEHTLSGVTLLTIAGLDPEADRAAILMPDLGRLKALIGAEWLDGLERPAIGGRYRADADGGGAILEIIPDQPGASVDYAALHQSIRTYLPSLLRRPGDRELHVPMVEVRHALSAEVLRALQPRLTRLAAQEISYTPGPSNGDAANILVPGRVFAGQVLAPGEWFDFWDQVGPLTRAAGYRSGGAFINGRVDPTGAFAGGICATATGLYAAAAKAGLEIGTRYPHFSYLSRYPLGIDATVWQTKRAEKTMRFRNDTSAPIVILVRQRPGFLRVEIHGIDDGRATTIAVGPLQGRRVGPNGMSGGSVLVVRTVTAADGSLLHSDRISSSYRPY